MRSVYVLHQALGRLLGTCKADAISASGRLASAPTSEHLHEHPTYFYTYIFTFIISNPEHHGKLRTSSWLI